MLGRWKREGSDTYVRMYNGVVTRLQQQFNHAARRNDRFRVLDERDILEAVAWMTHRMSWWEDDQIRHVIQHLEESMKLAPGIVGTARRKSCTTIPRVSPADHGEKARRGCSEGACGEIFNFRGGADQSEV